MKPEVSKLSNEIALAIAGVVKGESSASKIAKAVSQSSRKLAKEIIDIKTKKAKKEAKEAEKEAKKEAKKAKQATLEKALGKVEKPKVVKKETVK